MPKVRAITIDELDHLAVDENNRLYWDGKPVVTDERLTLAWWVNVAVVIGALSTLALAVLDVLRFSGWE